MSDRLGRKHFTNLENCKESVRPTLERKTILRFGVTRGNSQNCALIESHKSLLTLDENLGSGIQRTKKTAASHEPFNTLSQPQRCECMASSCLVGSKLRGWNSATVI